MTCALVMGTDDASVCLQYEEPAAVTRTHFMAVTHSGVGLVLLVRVPMAPPWLTLVRKLDRFHGGSTKAW